VLAKLRETARGVSDPASTAAMDKLETRSIFKQGETNSPKFFETDARRLAAGVRKVGRIEANESV